VERRGYEEKNRRRAGKMRGFASVCRRPEEPGGGGLSARARRSTTRTALPHHVAPPEAFAHLVDLAADLTGAFALHASDDYFAEKENLLRAGPAIWKEDAYTDKGKWMDGWESQRRREPGHDACIIRLGTPGAVHGLLVDTSHFKGNAPQEISLDGLAAADTTTVRALLTHPAWQELVPRTAVRPDARNEIALPSASPRVTHVRLRIYPDGGVARLRVYGVVLPDPMRFREAGSLDLAAVENGGTIAAVSDQFFGPPSNLLLPGRGVNMGDGWETKRRRTPGSDWCVIRLARRGRVHRIELDTHFFKGNAPQATRIEALDLSARDEADAGHGARLRAAEGWRLLVGHHPLVQHRCHHIAPDRPMEVTHLRVHIFPHGGVNRLRVWGEALDDAGDQRALASLAAMPEAEARALFLSFAGSARFAEALGARRPFASTGSLLAAAAEAWWSLGEADWLEAFAAHPRLGERKAAPAQGERSAAWSRGEQAALSTIAEDTATQLAAENARYLERFGFIFILCATGREADEVLAALQERIDHDRSTEIELAAREQAKITRLRIAKWLAAAAEGS
jgi:allantoicase